MWAKASIFRIGPFWPPGVRVFIPCGLSQAARRAETRLVPFSDSKEHVVGISGDWDQRITRRTLLKTGGSFAAGITLAGIASGPAFGFGYRKELDRIAIDISLTFLLANDTEVSDGVTMSIPKLGLLWNQDPIADSSAYYGIAVSYGFAAVSADGMLYGGSGLEGHLIGGYEMFRSSTIRGFIQMDVTLPFYKSNSEFSGTDTRWPVSAALSLGLGWGKSNVVRVINE